MCRSFSRAAFFCLLGLGVALPAAAQKISSNPTSLAFGNVYIGKTSGSKVLTITNISSGKVIINSIGFDCAGYGISSGVAPTALAKNGQITHYSVFLQPTAAQSYNCNFIITLDDLSTLIVPLTGTGIQSAGVASLSSTALDFGLVPAGNSSTTQTVTITNTGTTKLTLTAITPLPATFTVAPVTLPYTINSTASLSLNVNYNPTAAVAESGLLDLTFTEVADKGVDLTGTGTTPTSVSILTPALLPQATLSSAYQVQLNATGGKAPYNWGLNTGSTLPKGLKGSKSGLISGTLDPSVTAGTYTFSAFVKDAKAVQVSRTFTVNVYASPGAQCNNTVWNVTGTTSPMVALTDLGTGTYLGYQGGLYPNGSNVRPATHDSDGIGFATGIQPLDGNGNPSPTGKYVMLAIGESTAQNEFNRFLPFANADPQKNANLVIVNGAQGGATPNQFVASSSYYWSTILNNYLPQNGVTAKQVVAIWMEDTDAISSGTFPGDMSSMQAEYETLMNLFLTNFPNLKLVYMSPRVYAAYSNGTPKPDNPEPYAFETGYAIKNAIADQINGAANLNYNPNNGAVLAPWMAWGPYYWSNGLLGRADGLVWTCQDFSADGTHPSSTFGQLKVASALLTFFKTDTTTTPWYLQH